MQWHSLRCFLFLPHMTINSCFEFVVTKISPFSFVLQTVLKSLSVSVAWIDLVHHKDLLEAVSFYCMSSQLNPYILVKDMPFYPFSEFHPIYCD